MLRFSTAMIAIRHAGRRCVRCPGRGDGTELQHQGGLPGALTGAGGALDRLDAIGPDPTLFGRRTARVRATGEGVVPVRHRRPRDVRRGVGRGLGQSGLHRVDDVSRNGAGLAQSARQSAEMR
jgi:hypothetical protein